MEKKEILLKLIEHYAHGNKAEFARMLGVPPQNVSAWITRNSFDVDLVSTKCVGVNPSWLLTGKGEMLLTEPSSTEKTTDYDARINELLAICAMQEKTIKTLNEELTSMSQEVRSLVSCVRDLLTERVQRAYPTIASDADRHLNDKA